MAESYFCPLRFSMMVENVTIELIVQIGNGKMRMYFFHQKLFFKLIKPGLCF